MTVAELLTFLIDCDQSKEVRIEPVGWSGIIPPSVRKDVDGNVLISDGRFTKTEYP